MTELEYVQDAEIVDEKPSWESLISEFAEGTRHELAGQLRQARAAANVARHYGNSSMKAFAGEVGRSPAWCYDLAKVWTVFGHIFELDDELSSRLESLGVSHLIKSLRAPNPMEAVEEAVDENLTTRQMDERREEREQGEVAPKNFETVEMLACSKCGEVYPLREAHTYTEVAR